MRHFTDLCIEVTPRLFYATVAFSKDLLVPIKPAKVGPNAKLDIISARRRSRGSPPGISVLKVVAFSDEHSSEYQLIDSDCLWVANFWISLCNFLMTPMGNESSFVKGEEKATPTGTFLYQGL